MTFYALVDGVDHRSQLGRFARPGFACDEDQSLRLIAHIAHDFRHIQLFQGQGFGRNGAEHGANAVQVAHNIDPKS